VSSDADPNTNVAGPEDGRVLRGARNRRVIVEALLELIREGEMQPTAEQVAKRAGVGTRTVFRHFDDMEGLYAEMDARIAAEALPLLQSSRASDGPLGERVQNLARERARLFERIAPFKRSGNIQRPRSTFLQERHAEFARRLRADVASIFAPELQQGSESLLEVLDLLASFEAWDRLRSDQRLGRERAARVIEEGLLAVLGGPQEG